MISKPTTFGRVAVVGAGVFGVSAAVRLAQDGWEGEV